jgi:2-polyprenyl-3-methyl-5-hydroxy-6-metoxy-1,4-benzoquinol methylase
MSKAKGLDLDLATQRCRLLGDATRLRLLLLLDREELSVAELSAITQLAQPRVSTHLAKLREAGMVADRREGVFVYYRIAASSGDSSLDALWTVLRSNTDDPLAKQDRERIPQILHSRGGITTWADSVAGDMERHYSPGRSWEATARALTHLLDLGDVLDVASGDGVLAELLAPQSKSITCLDVSKRVVEAGRKRLSDCRGARFELGDMHDLPFESESFDTVLLMHALTYTDRPATVLKECCRVMRRRGRLLAVTLARHPHRKAVEPYDHKNLGFKVEALEEMAAASGFKVLSCAVTGVEKRKPNFSVITLHGAKS